MDKKIDFTRRICKFMPPQPMVVPTKDGITIQNLWPMMDTAQNCGQWQESQTEALLPGEKPLAVAQKAD